MLNKILVVILIVVVVVFVMFFFRAKTSQKGSPLGLIDGKLARCSSKPNCACTEFTEDKSHFVEPLDVSQVNMGQHFYKLAEAIKATGGDISKQTDDYISATYISGLFKFVDDVEARLDKTAGLIHVRSASREGYSDMGVNAKRVAVIKKAYNK